MKTSNKIISILLSACMFVGVCASCSEKSGSTESSGGAEKELGYIVFENDKFLYKAVLSENANQNEEFAAAELKTFLYESCGKQIQIVTDNAVTDADKCIFIGATKQTIEKNITVKESEVTKSGYVMKTVGEDMYINGSTTLGTTYGVYDFLNALIGFEVYSYDEIHIDEKEKIAFGDTDIVYKPYVEWRGGSSGKTFSDTLAATRMRLHMQKESFIMDYGATHTSFNFLPPTTYLSSHPDWYNVTNSPKQLCYTAHGNETELAEMKAVVLEKMKESVSNYAGKGVLPSYISFTHQDENVWCDCDTCSASKKKYGTPAAVMIQFLNPIAEELNAWMATEYPGQSINIAFFAYVQTEKAPVIINTAGQYEAVDDSVKMNEYVSTWYAPIYADYGRSFYDEQNFSYYDTMKRWAVICDDILLWTYCEHFSDYFLFHDTFGSMFETYKLIEEFNVSYLFDQGRYNAKILSAFGDFKVYLSAKLQWNINYGYEELKKDFFDNYYGSASNVMQNIFEETRTWFAYMKSIGYKCAFGINDGVSKKYWPQSTVENFIAMFDDAYKAIESMKKSNPERHQMLYDRILKEELAYSHILLELYSNTMSSKQLLETRNTWKTEVLRLGFNKKGENYSVENYWANW